MYIIFMHSFDVQTCSDMFMQQKMQNICIWYMDYLFIYMENLYIYFMQKSKT
jgi:hypothetical protein